MNIEGQDIKTCHTFVVLLDNTQFIEKIDFLVRNNSVTPNNKKNKQEMI